MNYFDICLIFLAIFTEHFWLCHTASDSKFEVTLPNGKKLNGVTKLSYYGNREYVELRGLRYAKPPTGEMRFHPTYLQDDIWDLEEDATKYGNICPQLDPWYNPDEEEDGSWDALKVLGDEDCLYANVATTNVNPESPLPVLVWIHGGNFQSESGQEYGVGKLMDYDLVVVTFNYRIGLLGFLNTEDGYYNGNQGLKDQGILLTWVQKTISIFGGDPNRVTLAGSNVGAVSTHLHLLSDFSQGLFHRAVIQSGTAISPWVLTKDPGARFQKLSKHLGCGNDTDVVMCLSEKDAQTIVQKTPKMTEWFLDPMVPFGPSVEMFGDTRDKFIAKDPYSILAEGNYWGKEIPVIMGVNSHEGLLHAMDIGHQAMLRMVFNYEWFGSGPISLYYKYSAMDPRSVSETVRDFYFPLSEDKEGNITKRLVDKDHQFDNLTNLYSDRHFFMPLYHSARLMGRSHDLYLYWFDYVSDQSIHGLFGYNQSHLFGPSHYDQLQYIFETPFFETSVGEEHSAFAKYFLDGFYNFISTGSPFYDNWKKVASGMLEGTEPYVYNRIGEMSKSIHLTDPFASRATFWNSIFLMEYDKGQFVNEFVAEQEASSTASQKTEL